MSNGQFVEFGLGDGDDGIGRKTEKFKGEGGRQYRLSFCWWQGMEKGAYPLTTADGLPQIVGKSPKFIGAKRHYFEGVGYILDGGPEFTKLAGNPPRMSIATVVIQWPINDEGKPDMQRVKDLDFKVLPWIFSDDKYKSFSPVHREFHFGAHDLTVNCSDTKFQKMTFSPCKDSVLAKLASSGKGLPQTITDHIIARTMEIASNIKNEIGREMTLDKLREKLTPGGGGHGSHANAAAASGSVATAEIDDLVGDILD